MLQEKRKQGIIVQGMGKQMNVQVNTVLTPSVRAQVRTTNMYLEVSQHCCRPPSSKAKLCRPGLVLVSSGFMRAVIHQMYLANFSCGLGAVFKIIYTPVWSHTVEILTKPSGRICVCFTPSL